MTLDEARIKKMREKITDEIFKFVPTLGGMIKEEKDINLAISFIIQSCATFMLHMIPRSPDTSFHVAVLGAIQDGYLDLSKQYQEYLEKIQGEGTLH